MGARKTVRKTGAGKSPGERAARLLARTAEAEVSELLHRSKAGTITRRQLDTGLTEVKKQLKELNIFIHKAE